ncbi:glycoside hydrolase family 95 protein [Parabacteroides sp. OttesenSCG-928-K15]|nr:glycoside hydrolase family 95 protein [Parabacteroides sp. OttesenSCG-928-K15]
MRKHTLLLVSGVFFLCMTMVSCQEKELQINENPSLSYYFSTPASAWNEAIPIGNGRMGGMVFGGVGLEKIQTNDDTFWSGEPRDLQKPGTHQYLPEIRKLIYEDKTAEAQKLINQYMLGPWNQNYMPLADILLEMGDDNATNYRRELDLSRGIVTVSYQQNGVNYKREIFASYPDQAIVIRLTADKKKSIHLVAGLQSAVKYKTHAEGNQVIINGQAPKHIEPNYQGKHDPIYEEGHGIRFEGRLIIHETDGEIQTKEQTIELRDASSATLVFVAATSYNGFDKDPFKEGKDEKLLCDKYIDQIKTKNYKKLYQNHTVDYTSLYGRTDIYLGESPDISLPINERIKNYQPGKDPALTALYFQFGRYLLISASRPGSQPSNLQGIWNHLLQPGWSANWTINCNAQLNYWPAEVGNLSECHLPLMDMIREAAVDGRKTAKNLYDSRGWMAHHNLDIWRTTWPVGGTGLWAIYQVGSGWLCQHIWEHYLFTLDKEFLREYYPLMRDAALFYLDNLFEDREGYLVNNPSESFENTFVKPNGDRGWACMGAAQDMQIIRALFKNTMAAIDILGEDKNFKQEIRSSYDRLAPMKISPTTGRLQEWNDDWEASSPQNGQVAQGWAFVASDLITLRGTPELADAFRKTIEYRKPGYSYNSGSWTGAFPANYWARFEEGDSVQRVIDRHFDLALSPNLTCDFTGFWEIDGNLGITAAIAEMLLQSHAGEISLLPALPSKYPDGYVKGLKARGDYEVDIYWKNGVLEKAVVQSVNGGDIKLRYKEKVKEYKLSPAQSLQILLSDL